MIRTSWRSVIPLAAVSTLATPTPQVEAAPDNALGMAMMAAYIEADGSFVRGSGVTANFKVGQGSYVVRFDRDVRQCFYSATPAFNGVLLSVQQHVDMRDVSVGGSDRSSGGSMDTSFFLLVFCNK